MNFITIYRTLTDTRDHEAGKGKQKQMKSLMVEGEV